MDPAFARGLGRRVPAFMIRPLIPAYRGALFYTAFWFGLRPGGRSGPLLERGSAGRFGDPGYHPGFCVGLFSVSPKIPE